MLFEFSNRIKLWPIAVVLGVVLMLAALACGSSATPKEAIVFSDLSWTSAQVQNRIAQYIVEKGYGYPTEVVFGDTLPLFQGLRKGDTNVTMEIWLPNQRAAWDEAVAEGEVFPVGMSLGNDWQSTFVIPAYMQEQYPDLDHVDDLKDPKFQEVFKTTDSRGKARLVGCPTGWECEAVNIAQIEGYGLTDYLHVINPGSQDALFAEITGVYAKKEAWLGFKPIVIIVTQDPMPRINYLSQTKTFCVVMFQKVAT